METLHPFLEFGVYIPRSEVVCLVYIAYVVVLIEFSIFILIIKLQNFELAKKYFTRFPIIFLDWYISEEQQYVLYRL